MHLVTIALGEVGHPIHEVIRPWDEIPVPDLIGDRVPLSHFARYVHPLMYSEEALGR